MPTPDLFTRTFTEAELIDLAIVVRFTHRMLEAADYPQEKLDDIALLQLRVVGADLEIKAASEVGDFASPSVRRKA